MQSDNRLFEEHCRLGAVNDVTALYINNLGYLLTWSVDASNYTLMTWEGKNKAFKSLDTLASYLRKNAVKTWVVDVIPSMQAKLL